jgi:hypothetical protein
VFVFSVQQSGREPVNVRCFNPQFFIGSRVGDVALEQQYEERVQSYAQQFGVLVDAVRVLCTMIPAGELGPADQAVVEQFMALAERASAPDSRIATQDAVLTIADVEQFIRRLQHLRQVDPASADQVVRRLADEVGTPTPAGTT